MSAASMAVSALGRPQEKRSSHRYPLQLEMEYRLLNRGRVERSGSGKTLNISSTGVFFEATEPLPAGSLIELMMSWPFLLEGVCPLKLVMRGRVVRNAGTEAAIVTRHHEFRTAGARASKGPAPHNQVRSLA